MRKTVAAFFLIFLAAGASAHLDLRQQHLPDMKQSFNSRATEVPAIAGALIGNQTAVVHVTGNETVNITAGFQGVHLETLKRGSSANATVEVWVSRTALVEIGESENPRSRLKQALESGALRIEVDGFFNQLRFSLVRALL